MNESLQHKLMVAVTNLLVVLGMFVTYQQWHQPTIKVGIMHSLSGTMASSESAMVDAAQLAIEEINAEGGLLGRQIAPIIADGRSDPHHFAELAQQLISEERVDVVFGCWTSSCRKSVLPIFEKHNHLLYYPLQYEGIERSENIIYLGAVPNQQVVPALEWSLSKLGKRIYLIGSDYVYPRAANQIIKDQAQQWRGQIVGESYVPLSSGDFEATVAQIKRSQPDVIFSTINGSSNLDFFRALRAAGISPDKIPTFSFSIAEDKLAQFADIDMNGDFLVWNYLQADDSDTNADFIRRFKARFGQEREVGNPMINAYMAVHLWAKAVRKTGTSNVHNVRRAAADLSLHGPNGMMYIEPGSRHAWKAMHIGQIDDQHQLRSVWFSKVPIAPKPYPASRSVAQWNDYLQQLKAGWQGHWQAN